MSETERCKETVYIRDQYRYSGRGSSGFSMHYIERRCSRIGRPNGYCWQHDPRDTAACIEGHGDDPSRGEPSTGGRD